MLQPNYNYAVVLKGSLRDAFCKLEPDSWFVIGVEGRSGCIMVLEENTGGSGALRYMKPTTAVVVVARNIYSRQAALLVWEGCSAAQTARESIKRIQLILQEEIGNDFELPFFYVDKSYVELEDDCEAWQCLVATAKWQANQLQEDIDDEPHLVYPELDMASPSSASPSQSCPTPLPLSINEEVEQKRRRVEALLKELSDVAEEQPAVQDPLPPPESVAKLEALKREIEREEELEREEQAKAAEALQAERAKLREVEKQRRITRKDKNNETQRVERENKEEVERLKAAAAVERKRIEETREIERQFSRLTRLNDSGLFFNLYSQVPEWDKPETFGDEKVFERESVSFVDKKFVIKKLPSITLRVIERPFQNGNVRHAFYALSGKERYILKLVTETEVESKRRQQALEDIRAQQCSVGIAEEFSKQLKAKGVTDTTLTMLEAQLVWREGDEMDDGVLYYSLEKCIDGSWEKFTNNFDKSSVDEHPLLGAFSHFSYAHTQRSMMVVDLQGTKSDGGEYILTDPAVHTSPAAIAEKNKKFGATDRRAAGLKAFFLQHTCNSHCKTLGIDATVPSDTEFDKHAPPVKDEDEEEEKREEDEKKGLPVRATTIVRLDATSSATPAKASAATCTEPKPHVYTLAPSACSSPSETTTPTSSAAPSEKRKLLCPEPIIPSKRAPSVPLPTSLCVSDTTVHVK